MTGYIMVITGNGSSKLDVVKLESIFKTMKVGCCFVEFAFNFISCICFNITDYLSKCLLVF